MTSLIMQNRDTLHGLSHDYEKMLTYVHVSISGIIPLKNVHLALFDVFIAVSQLNVFAMFCNVFALVHENELHSLTL